MRDGTDFKSLTDFLLRIPAIRPGIGTGQLDSGGWYANFGIDIDHPLAWNVVQELGHILNFLSLDDRLPTVFIPVSPPPYMNGGPRDYLSWVIECSDPSFGPDSALKWLEGRLPRPVDAEQEWLRNL
jgi:hypothetical protein